ncbi:alpha-hydroxy acid oxidase [Streptomyces sp. RLB1-33]|nr:alpha-hydroxy acid oxidase [Streptomyces sp. RLB1-33]QIY68657.1 alpha-hydroxy-acid oxidizing protein [Streptomyces sp. RLB1-33]
MTVGSPGAAPALSLAEYAARACAELDGAVWDFIAGGAGEERTLAENTEAFDRVRLRPRVLTGSGTPLTATRILGRYWAAPLAVAPMGYHTLVHPEGEVAAVRAAGAAGIPFIASTFAGRAFEELAAAAAAPLWLQVYCFRDRARTRQLITRAEQAGFEAVVLTVDAPRLGRRLRDLRNGFRLPPGVVPANLDGGDFSSPVGHALSEFEPAMDWTVVEWLRSVSALPVLLKGILTGDDARRAVYAGADGVIVSNHGGRQLDGVPATFDVLPEVVEAVAHSCPVLVDGGIRRGRDVLACLAQGADAVLLGRPVLHGLAVGGQQGVAGVLQVVLDELVDAMALSGIASADEAGPGALQSVQRTL